MLSIQESLVKLRNYIEKDKFRGYDPYDTLTSPVPFGIIGKWGKILAIQVQKRNPVNIRPLLGIRKRSNSMSTALLLDAYVYLAAKENPHAYREQIQTLFTDLKNNYAKGFHGHCWGYSFGWATSEKFLPENAPNIVATAFVVRALSHLRAAIGTSDEQLKKETEELILSAARFVTEDLPREENADGTFFSYTPFRKDCVYNASLFAAEILSHADILSPNDEYRRLAIAAVEFVLTKQKADGNWNYSLNLHTGAERVQIDFHQGYILDSIHHIQQNLKVENNHWRNALRNGMDYYRREQFLSDGRSRWRIPKDYPVEIQNQAQGIITFTKLSYLDSSYSFFARQIAQYTIATMQDEEGFFYYRKFKKYTNKISYLRWGNAPMFLGLSMLP